MHEVAFGPFRRVVILGESNAYGMCASRPEFEWNEVLAGLLRRFQDDGPEVLNRAIPASVTSPRCPGYGASARPSLLERYQRHGLDPEPDLLIVAQALNDMRAGMPVQDYLEDMGQILGGIRASSQALVVLVGIYPQVYGKGFNDPAITPEFSKGNATIEAVYNCALRQLAEEHGALFVDTPAALGHGEWMLHPDCCHLNDLAHLLLGNAIFQALATRGPGLAARTLRLIEERGISVANTGGANSDEEIRALWEASEMHPARAGKARAEAR